MEFKDRTVKFCQTLLSPGSMKLCCSKTKTSLMSIPNNV